MSADRIDRRSLLTNKQVARAMEHQAALLLEGDIGCCFVWSAPSNALHGNLRLVIETCASMCRGKFSVLCGPRACPTS
jgi:hypothetical protein